MNFQSLPLPFPRFQGPVDLLVPVRQCECNCIAACRCACSCRDHCTCKASCEGTCAGHVSRNLIVSLDDVYKKLGPESTNVLELHSRVLADTNPSQLTYYDCAGIQYSNHTGFRPWLRRVQNTVDRVLGRTFKKPVLKAYRWLCEQYKPGDKIFLFGFARGGRQALTLSDTIEKVGLVNAGNPDLIEFSYNLYLETQSGQANSVRDAEKFKATFSRDVKIHFIGVWDTPQFDSKFCSLPSSAKHVCFFRHALGLDEPRGVKFFPVYNPEHCSPPKRVRFLEKENDDNDDTASTETKVPIGQGRGTDGISRLFPGLGQVGGIEQISETKTDVPNIKEVWFTGDQADIGGVKPNKALSSFPLLWMENEASSSGLHLRVRAPAENWNPDVLIEAAPVLKSALKPIRGRKLFPGTNRTPHIRKARFISRAQRIHASVAFQPKEYRPRAIFNIGGSWHNFVGQDMKQRAFDWVTRYRDFLEMDLFGSSFMIAVIHKLINTWNGEELSDQGSYWFECLSFMALSENLCITYLSTLKPVSDADHEMELACAVNFFQKLANQRPAIFSGDLAEILEAQGRFFLLRGKGDPHKLFEDALLFRRAQAAMPTSSSFTKYKLGASLVWFGSYAVAMHKPQKALNLFGEGLEILRPLIAREYSPAISLFVLLQRNFTSCLKDIHESHIDLGLTVAETIVAVGRALVGAYPQYRPLLAAALHDLAFAFPARQSSHEPDAAEECISLYQDLANRDCQAYNERYADALYNFSRRLFAIGEYQSALRASLEETQLRRKLRDKEYLASCLDHLSRCLGAAGQIDVALNIAEEAVRIRRKLVEENMTWKFESQLAESLNNLSHCLLLAPNCAQRALSSAREAASIQRGHARDTRAEAFNLRLGVFLHNFSVILSAVGRNEEALRAQEEAVQILTRGGDSSCVQALSLSHLASCLRAVARQDEALLIAENCLTLVRGLAAIRPIGFDLHTETQLAETFLGLSFCFTPHQHAKAIESVTDSITIYRKLVKYGSPFSNTGLTRAVLQHSYLLSSNEQHEDALRLAVEASQIGGGLGKDMFSICLYRLSLCLYAVGKDAQGMQPAQQCVDIRRKLVEEDGTWQSKEQLADALFNLSLYSSRLSAGTALQVVREAVEIHRGLSEHIPLESFNKRLTDGLQNLAAHALLAGAHDEAFSSAEEAVGITRKLVDINPSQHSPTLVNVLYTYANILCENAEYERSHSVILEAEALRETICSDSIFVSLEASAAYMSTQARCFVGLGRRDDGLRSVMGAIQLYEMDFSSPQKIMFESFPWFLRNIVCCISALGENGVNVAEAKTDVVGLSRMLAGYDPDKYERYLQHVIEL